MVPTVVGETVGYLPLLHDAMKFIAIVFAPGNFLVMLFVLATGWMPPFPWIIVVAGLTNGAVFVGLAKVATIVPAQYRLARIVVVALPFVLLFTYLVLAESGAI